MQVYKHEGGCHIEPVTMAHMFFPYFYTDAICKTLMEKNTHIAIIEGMRRHITNIKAVCAACRAIRGLCIFKSVF